MIQKLRIATFSMIAILACFSSLFSQELKKVGRYYVYEFTGSWDVQKGGELRVYDIHGDVTVETWDKNEIFVKERLKMDVFTEEEAQTVLEKSRSSYRKNGNRLEIGGEYYRRDWIVSDFDIKVPKEFNVDIETRSGDVRVGFLLGQVDIHTSGGDITLTNIDGEVDAKTSGGNIEVVNSTKRVSIKTSGGDLDLENIGGPLTAGTSGGDIILNGSKDRVELHTSGGDIRLRNAGGKVKAHTSGGDIVIIQAMGSVEVHTSGGDIEIRDVDGELDASTSGGDIEGKNINGSVTVSTSGGSIELKNVKGGVEGKTAGGDISVEITLTDFSKDHRVDLRTAGGEITLYIPEKLPATINAEIEISERWEDYDIYSDFALRRVEDDDSRDSKRRGRRYRRGRKYIRSEGDINGGGDRIELYTTNGDIHIKKLRK